MIMAQTIFLLSLLNAVTAPADAAKFHPDQRPICAAISNQSVSRAFDFDFEFSAKKLAPESFRCTEVP